MKQSSEVSVTMSAVHVLYTIVIGAMLLFAVLSNCLVVYCVVRFRKLRTVTNVFICNLSISDILLAGCILPMKIHDIFHEEDFFEGEILCKMVNVGPIFIISSSIYTLVCISFERHRSIIDLHGREENFQKVKVLICVIWLSAFVVSVPTLLEYSVLTICNKGGNISEIHLSCGSQKSHNFALFNAILVFFVSYFIPVILIFRNYLNIALFLWKQSRRIGSNLETTGDNSTTFHLFKARIKLVKLLVLVAVIFALSWFPFFVMLLYAKRTGGDGSENAAGFANLLLIGLATFSTAYNVILYVVFNPTFKRAIHDILKCAKSDMVRLELNDGVTPSPQECDDALPVATYTSRIFTVKSHAAT